MGTDLLERPKLDEPGTGDRVSHRARKSDLMRYYIEGGTVKALCGYEWQPVTEDVKNPLCQKCKAIYDQMKG